MNVAATNMLTEVKASGAGAVVVVAVAAGAVDEVGTEVNVAVMAVAAVAAAVDGAVDAEVNAAVMVMEVAAVAAAVGGAVDTVGAIAAAAAVVAVTAPAGGGTVVVGAMTCVATAAAVAVDVALWSVKGYLCRFRLVQIDLSYIDTAVICNCKIFIELSAEVEEQSGQQQEAADCLCQHGHQEQRGPGVTLITNVTSLEDYDVTGRL
jgi:hypothetical protein